MVTTLGWLVRNGRSSDVGDGAAAGGRRGGDGVDGEAGTGWGCMPGDGRAPADAVVAVKLLSARCCPVTDATRIIQVT
jgi:hypothetical protein